MENLIYTVYAIVRTTRRVHVYRMVKRIKDDTCLSATEKLERIKLVKDYFKVK